jgi:hypothetical protein
MADPKDKEKGVNPFAKKDEPDTKKPEAGAEKEPEGKKEPMKDGEKTGLDKEKVAESIRGLFKGVELSEKIVESVVLIATAAIAEQTELASLAAIAEAREDYESKFDVEVTKLAESVDKYLTHGVRKFIDENKIAITEGLRQEAAHKILESAKGICESYGLEISDDEQATLEEAESKVTLATEKLDESLNREIELQNEVDNLKKERSFKAVTEGMVLTDAERLGKLAESISFNDESDYADQLKTLKESFIGGTKVPKEPLNLNEGKTVDAPKVDAKAVKLDESTDQKPKAAPKSRKF